MTVISAIITKHCTAIASDSLITVAQPDGTKKPVEWKKSKIIRIPAFRGSASYWGLAEYGHWNTYDWLKKQCDGASKFKTFELFAKALKDSLGTELKKIPFATQTDGGIGIHLTGYENIETYWIPELFLCSNFTDISYSKVGNIGLSRETYHILSGDTLDEKHKEQQCRFSVRDYLSNNSGILIFNNGDPKMFSPTAGNFLNLMRTLTERGLTKDMADIELVRSLVRRPIEIVAKAQQDFCREDMRIVGGQIHDLVIKPTGDYTSSSGD